MPCIHMGISSLAHANILRYYIHRETEREYENETQRVQCRKWVEFIPEERKTLLKSNSRWWQKTPLPQSIITQFLKLILKYLDQEAFPKWLFPLQVINRLTEIDFLWNGITACFCPWFTYKWCGTNKWKGLHKYSLNR